VRASAWRSLAVFAGPSLPPPDRRAFEGVTYLPPASRGDVLQAARDYDAVLLIDGVFHHDLAPSPKECYDATRHAMMFGASSMGALRAAECAPFGFLPLGAIARWYANGAIDGDDEVAVLTHPQTHAALTVPLVNVRFAARFAHRRGMLSRAQCGEWIEAARGVYYMDRNWIDVLDAAPDAVRAVLLERNLAAFDLKRIDAVSALQTVLRMRARGIERRRNAVTIPQALPTVSGTYDRAVPFEQTLALVPMLRERYGITRVAETTYLDWIGIPTFSAMVPHSPDLLGVYNGKGMTRDAAIVSAVMEATERQIGAAVRLPVFREKLAVVAERIDLDACGMREDVRERSVECVAGTDLLTGDVVPVPLAMVQCPYFGEKLFDTTSSNGLASGNNLTEAIYHALCELIERHVWSVYHARCSLAPRYFGGASATDRSATAGIALPCGEPNADRLAAMIAEAGLIVRAQLLEEPPLPPVVIATVTEPASSPPMAHMGLGCSLSPAHALVRALTEAVQSRATDIQAAREDMLRADEPPGMMGDHARRISALPTDQWYYMEPARTVALNAVNDRRSGDLARDVRTVLDSLRSYGASCAVAVDLSPPDLPMAVVRTIVPEMETFMFTGRAGPRVRAELNPFAVRSA
jgi:ribosomal protein S12 methylthiotransferase accessory factor